MPAVAKVNSDVQQAIGELHDQRVVFVDCGAAFLDAAGEVDGAVVVGYFPLVCH